MPHPNREYFCERISSFAHFNVILFDFFLIIFYSSALEINIEIVKFTKNIKKIETRFVLLFIF